MAATTVPRADATLAYDRLAHAYDDGYAGPQWRIYDRVTLATAATFLPPAPARVLDAGAGSGKFALEFLARGYDVTLLDPSPGMLAEARRKIEAAGYEARAHYAEGGIERMDFDDGAFDFVFCEGDPLSYCVTTWQEASRELVRVLRPGGGLYVSCDNRWLATRTLLAMGRPDLAFQCADEGASFDPYGVGVRAFTPQELREAFAAAGARDVRVTGKIVLTHLVPEETLARIMARKEDEERLVALEERLAEETDLAGTAGHLHVVARRAGGASP